MKKAQELLRFVLASKESEWLGYHPFYSKKVSCFNSMEEIRFKGDGLFLKYAKTDYLTRDLAIEFLTDYIESDGPPRLFFHNKVSKKDHQVDEDFIKNPGKCSE